METSVYKTFSLQLSNGFVQPLLILMYHNKHKKKIKLILDKQ